MKKILLLVILVSVFCCGALIAQDGDTSVSVDWGKSTGDINRAIFSTQGFMQVYVCEDPRVMDTFDLLNPWGTQTRLETYIHRMEPENDNDDPNVFNWEKFHPQKMIRFIDKRSEFSDTLDFLGMDRLFLACYMVEWLKSGNPDYPIKNNDEWAEFVAAVVETYNGSGDDYQLNLKYVEVWNEPNMSDFYSGTMQSYFDLFNTVADRIHRDYPGVMVGGPALTHAPHCAPDEWMEEFIKHCGKKADFISYHHYGPQGEPVSVLTDDIKKWVGKFRAIPGKEKGQVMLTELDAWFHGWPKAKHIMERQFRFLDLSDYINSIHHFCCLAYNEAGNYTFGIVNTQGGVLPGTFWPYWLFRNLAGDKSYYVKQGPGEKNIDLIASSISKDGQFLGTAVLRNKTSKPMNVPVQLFFEPANEDRVLAFNSITQNFKGIEKVKRIPAGSHKFSADIKLDPDEGLALTLQEEGKRIYRFRDMNNQEMPWLSIESDKDVLDFQESCTLDVHLLNTTFKPVAGAIVISGLPEGWKAELVKGAAEVAGLPFGKEHECSFRIKMESVVPGEMFSPYAELIIPGGSSRDLDQTPHSIPYSIKGKNPFKSQILPLPVFAVPGETNQVTLQIENQISREISGEFSITLPPGLTPQDAPDTFKLGPNEMKRFQFPFKISENTGPETVQGNIVIHFMGTTFKNDFAVEIVDKKPVTKAIPMNLNEYNNLDAAAFFRDRLDYDRSKIGLFVYPADYTPSERLVNIRGVPYRFSSLENGKKNVILPLGQTIPVPEDQYTGVSFIGYGQNGKHPGEWKFHYTDGSVETKQSQVPEWCSPTPPGFEVAFNAPYRYIQGGPAHPACQLWVWTIETNPDKILASVELPDFKKDAFIFAITLLKK